MKPLTIVFAGTPAFALPCLDALHASAHSIKAVYTQPDRPSGRGRHVQASAVKEWAVKRQLPVYQPIHFKHDEAIEELRALQPDILVVIAYGLILPETVLTIPRLGAINVHASLLPRWRGAAPIQYAILHNDTTTGVSIMQMDKGMDTGDVLTTVACPITADETAQTLHDRLAELAAAPLLATLDALHAGYAIATPQDAAGATYAKKIQKTDAIIHWSHTASSIDSMIRAYTPWPIAYIAVGDTVVRIHQARVVAEQVNMPPGTIVAIDTTGVSVATAKDLLCIERIQLPGGKVVSIADCLHAKRLPFTLNQVLV